MHVKRLLISLAGGEEVGRGRRGGGGGRVGGPEEGEVMEEEVKEMEEEETPDCLPSSEACFLLPTWTLGSP